MLSADEAILTRKSIRAFLDKPVPRETVEEILAVAARAPSGTNMQPWRATVLTGAARTEFCHRLEALALEGEAGTPQYAYYPPVFREPYLTRRRKVGYDLYATLGIQKGDKARMHGQHAKNFTFFNAPVGLIFTIDDDLELGSWLDYGMFLENVMIAARARGLDTCPQAAFITYHREIRDLLAIPADQRIVCGMALGHRDPEAPENLFETQREPVSAFATFLETLPR
ncbi:nitroreductase [Rhabdaerophilum sp. SD176]|uniref:nitroreductase n=1 Tax=Rhabdaerophilum sp. SD176 TaxID=2983548 RepID=UPI0024DFF34B|nr:nitroreductase [Rhabdaerophilum sp. SD176]